MSLVRDAITHLTTIRGAVRRKASIPIPIGASWVKADDGAPLAVFSNGASDVPGTQITDSKVWTIRWNNHAAPLGVAINVPLPQDLDTTYPLDINFLVSKTGATAGDISSLTVAAYVNAAGALHDADANCGGVTNVVTPDATAKTGQWLRRRIAAVDLASPPAWLAFSATPTAGTLGTDDLLLLGCWLDYTAKYI